MTAMTAADFERRYRADPDPWRYRTSAYEHAKYAATLEACGPGPFTHALELGGSVGDFSARLAPRCRSLDTVDFSPTAVLTAEAALAAYPQARAILGEIPQAMPDGEFDLVVASEVLYYLSTPALANTLELLAARIVPRGRLVCVHWREPGPERPLSAADVHSWVRGLSWLTSSRSETTDDYLLDVLDRR
jgi:cyclopropane fatty-acyl-phospholipid synthase-like methyltransferase